MGWFGGSDSAPQGGEKSFASDDLGGNFEPMSAPMGGGAASEFQQFSVGLQQQLLVQQAITDIADRAFMKCITSNKENALNGKEVACISAVTNKWLDTNEFMAGRLQRKSQKQQQQQFG